MKILLLQAREETDVMRTEERRSFAEKAGLDLDQLVTHNLLDGPPSLAGVRRHDALMVGGSGDYYVSREDLPGFGATLDLLREVTELGHPMFASCFGFQLLTRALGGAIVHDTDRLEVDTYELTLTEEGAADPLFGYLPSRFLAQVGRKDRTDRLPAGVLHLAASERCPYHAFRVSGAPIWATQFHPELDAEENKARYLNYLEGYGGILSPAERRAALDNFRDSPEIRELIPRFLDLVFG